MYLENRATTFDCGHAMCCCVNAPSLTQLCMDVLCSSFLCVLTRLLASLFLSSAFLRRSSSFSLLPFFCVRSSFLFLPAFHWCDFVLLDSEFLPSFLPFVVLASFVFMLLPSSVSLLFRFLPFLFDLPSVLSVVRASFFRFLVFSFPSLRVLRFFHSLVHSSVKISSHVHTIRNVLFSCLCFARLPHSLRPTLFLHPVAAAAPCFPLPPVVHIAYPFPYRRKPNKTKKNMKNEGSPAWCAQFVILLSCSTCFTPSHHPSKLHDPLRFAEGARGCSRSMCWLVHADVDLAPSQRTLMHIVV